MRNPFRRPPASTPDLAPDLPPRRGYKRLSPDGLQIVEFSPVIQETLRLYGLRGSYGALYRAQPNVRTCVDFMAAEVAAVKLKLYERVPTSPTKPTGRIELDDHDEILLLNRPAPRVTRTRLWDATVRDIMIYDVAYWEKFIQKGKVAALLRIPPVGLLPIRDPITFQITEYHGSNGRKLTSDQLVIFPGYDPENTTSQVPPMETLRRNLAEEHAAGANRENMWKRSARKGGIVERPMDADWSEEEREAWRTDWASFMAGELNSGATGLLEDGMKWVDVTWSPAEAEYLGARKLNREECAAAFRIDPTLVYASGRAVTKEDRTGFYVDRLVPFLTRLEEEIDIQLLPEFEPFDRSRRFYHQFNIDEKMRGSFEEALAAASSAVGGPWVTVNEIRARHNMPPIPGGDRIFIPLNSVRGGGPQGSPQAPVQTPGPGVAPGETPGGGTAPPGEGAAAAGPYFRFNSQSGEFEPTDWTPPAPAIHVHVHTDGKTEDSKSPPWHVEKRGDEWCVVKDETGESVGCHPTKKAANAQLAALFASEANVDADDAAATPPKKRRYGYKDPDDHARFLKESRARFEERALRVLERSFDRQRNAVLGGKEFDRKRWDRELASDLTGVALQTTMHFGADAAARIGGTYDENRTLSFIESHTGPIAQAINDRTETELGVDGADPKAVFDDARDARAPQSALSLTTWAMNWAVREAAHQNGG